MHLRSQKTTNLVGNVRHALKDLMRLRIWAESMDSVRFSGFGRADQMFPNIKEAWNPPVDGWFSGRRGEAVGSWEVANDSVPGATPVQSWRRSWGRWTTIGKSWSIAMDPWTLRGGVNQRPADRKCLSLTWGSHNFSKVLRFSERIVDIVAVGSVFFFAGQPICIAVA